MYDADLWRARTVPVREKRRGALAAYHGTLSALADEARSGFAPRLRTFTHDHASDLQRALELLGGIDGLGVVVHGPAGCAGALRRAGTPWAVSALTQRDSIMGGEARLRQALRELHAAARPQAIAVVVTPVVAINNDDVETVVAELADELALPIFAVPCDGLRSKLAESGLDTAVHALFRHLLPPRPQPRPHARGTHALLLAGSSVAADLRVLQGLLAEVGMPTLAFPAPLSVQQLPALAAARVAIGLDGDDSELAGHLLERGHGVPFLAVPPPVGRAATDAWLAAVAEATGHGAQAALLAARHERRLAAPPDALQRHRGARVVVALPAVQAFAFAGLLDELGLLPAAFVLPSVAAADHEALAAAAARWPAAPVLVGAGQAFEEANLLQRLKPDLVVSRGAARAHVWQLGVPLADLSQVPIAGYAGFERSAQAIAHALGQRALAAWLASDGGWTPTWLARSGHWYVKQEAR